MEKMAPFYLSGMVLWFQPFEKVALLKDLWFHSQVKSSNEKLISSLKR